MSSTDLNVPPEYRLITEDKRRKRVRLTPFAILSGVVTIALAVALIVYGAQQIWAAGLLRPMPTPAPTSAAVAAQDATPTPEASPAPAAAPAPACPTDRAKWRLVPYTMPGPDGDQTLYQVDPPCVMEWVEQAFHDYLAYYKKHGREWTVEEQDRFYSQAGFTAPLNGETYPEMTAGWPLFCVEETNLDGTPTEPEVGVVFYAISQDGLVADLLYVSKPTRPFVTRQYDCATGELTGETPNDGTQALVLYQPLLYEDGAWRLAYRYDVMANVPADQELTGLVALVLDAQGRDEPR